MAEKKQFIRGFATRAIHGSDIAKGEHVPVSTPIYQTSSFNVKRVLTGAQVRPEFIYTRGGNPTTREFEQKMASLENTEMGFAFASGMGAIAGTILSLLQTGDELITDREVYGGTFSLMNDYLVRHGIQVHFINMTNETQIEDTINEKTRMLYMESPMNPTLKLVDIKQIVKIAKEHQLITVFDNTFCSPCLQNPIDYGVDYVIHSCTKYIGGHGDALGGITLGASSNIIKIMSESLDLGATLSPFNAWLFLRGLKTLEVRMERHCKNALELAKYLETEDVVERVLYPGLSSHPQHGLATKQMRNFGGIISFYLKKGTNVTNLVKNLEIPAYTVSLGDADTFIEDPFNLSHFSVPRKIKKAAGITKYMLRISVGLESIEDLIDDFRNAFRQL
ncbi:MAG: trans-sulfuration enzyme family protein [Candidatus Helarchaeota archaeon]